MNIRADIYVKNEDKFIYKIDKVQELGSTSLCFEYGLELVAGYEYINPDYSNEQGYVEAEAFTDDVQWFSFTVLPLEESLGERLKEEGFEVINIEDYKIHPFLQDDDIDWEEDKKEQEMIKQEEIKTWRIANGFESAE